MQDEVSWRIDEMTFELYFWFSELEGDVECENCKELMTLIDTIVSSQKVEDFVSILRYFHIYRYKYKSNL